LARTRLAARETIAADRLYAIENGPSGFDPAAPVHLPKVRFLMLMRNERLAALRTEFDESSHVLVVSAGGCDLARGDLRTAEGRAAIETLFSRRCADDLRGAPKVLSAPGHSFSDVKQKVVSIINLASVAAIGKALGARVNPLRFRGNIYVDGWPAWREFDFVGREIRLGSSARLRVIKRITRCAATHVDPETGTRDLMILEALADAFGHTDCGVYAEVAVGGDIAPGDAVDGAEIAGEI
jgi:uncharacterized protein YcbX